MFILKKNPTKISIREHGRVLTTPNYSLLHAESQSENDCQALYDVTVVCYSIAITEMGLRSKLKMIVTRQRLNTASYFQW